MVAVETHQGLYEYTALPFGVSSAPAMDSVLQGIPNVICYLDDILVAGRSEKQHLENLEAILSRLLEHGIRLKREKCVFFQDRVEYLGHKINSQGIYTSTKKAQAVIDQPVPQNIPQLQSFLGMINYYGKFIPNLSPMLHPLHALLHAGQPWVWSKACNQAFKKAKGHLTRAPILVHYDPDLPIVLAADASMYGLGAVISHHMKATQRGPLLLHHVH